MSEYGRYAKPSQGVISSCTGRRAQLSVEARWSEARDTTLVVWVGLETPGQQRDVCEPIYGTDSDDGVRRRRP